MNRRSGIDKKGRGF